MKLRIALPLLFAAISSFAANDTDSTNHSEHLDLYAVLSVFQEANDLEDFEKKLNDADLGINNLDLNGDDKVDYIRIIDHIEEEAHAITLRVPISETEEQDVAVIELEKTGDAEAQLQIIGDEDIYGEAYYLEPKGTGNTEHLFGAAVVVNVWSWSVVRFIYAPGYKRYISPWGWRRYPKWWGPRRPVALAVYRPRVAPHRAHFHRVKVHRTFRAHKVYHKNRVASRQINRRPAVRQAHRKSVKRNHHRRR